MKQMLVKLEKRLSRFGLLRWGFSLMHRYSELIRYGIIGVLTTGVNFLIYLLCTRLFFVSLFEADSERYALLFNVIAWGGAVLFAFFANRTFVFNSREKGNTLLWQFLSFVALRVASGVLEVLSPSALIRFLSMNDILAKAIVSVAIILLNYFFTKFVTFAKRARPDGQAEEKELRPLDPPAEDS